MRVPISEATQGQLLQFLQVRMGQKVHPATGMAKLVAMTRKLWAEDFIDLDDQNPAGGNAGPVAGRGGYGDSKTGKVAPPKPAANGKIDPLRYAVLDPRVSITMHADGRHGKGGSRNVFVGNNGVEYFIPRGKKVEIPYRFFRVLEEAEGDIHSGWDDDIRGNAEKATTKSYLYTVNRHPTDAEIEAWREMMEPLEAKQGREKMRRINRTRRIDADAHA